MKRPALRLLRPPTPGVAALALVLATVAGAVSDPVAPSGVVLAAASPAARVSVAPVARRARLDRRVAVTGQVLAGAGTPVAGARVAVQVRTRRGWATPPGYSGVADPRGRFRLRAPTFYYGRHVFRVAVLGTAVASGAQTVTVPVPYRPAGRAGAGSVSPTRFDPCAPIPYRINFAGAPAGARGLIAAALRKARAASGLTFVYAGAYAGVPFSRQPDAGLPASGIGFAWTTPSRVRQLAGSPIGLGGAGWTTGSRRTSSGVVIDRTFTLRRGWSGANSIGGLVLHELGHALGLEHVSDPRQQMYPREVGAPNGNYNRGDLSALRRIGLDAGCL
jgi:hypothetical protein